MNYLFSLLLSYLLLYKYTTLFLVVLATGFLLPLPANTMLVAVGAFASQGYMNVWVALGVAQVANMIGDFGGFMLTRIYGKPIVKKLKLEKSVYFKRIERYIHNHAGLTIIVTRFITNFSLSSLVNFLAGLAAIPIGSFLLFDFIGNILSNGMFLAFGYFLGQSWQDFSTILVLGAAILLVASLAVGIIIASRQNGDVA